MFDPHSILNLQSLLCSQDGRTTTCPAESGGRTGLPATHYPLLPNPEIRGVIASAILFGPILGWI